MLQKISDPEIFETGYQGNYSDFHFQPRRQNNNWNWWDVILNVSRRYEKNPRLTFWVSEATVRVHSEIVFHDQYGLYCEILMYYQHFLVPGEKPQYTRSNQYQHCLICADALIVRNLLVFWKASSGFTLYVSPNSCLENKGFNTRCISNSFRNANYHQAYSSLFLWLKTS